MIQAISSFLDVCYLARRTDLDQMALKEFDTSLTNFYTFREVFRTSGVRPTGFSLPRQHSLSHYSHLIKEFGAPGGVCSSITESCHITAVKKPWRCSNRYQALGQMLLTNQRLDKLAAARVNFVNCGMLDPNNPPHPDVIQISVPIAGRESEDDDVEIEAEPARPGGTVQMRRQALIVTGNVTLARSRGMSFKSFRQLLSY